MKRGGRERIKNKEFWTQPQNFLWLRDNFRCPRCVDPSTSQKQFQTCDIPLNLTADVVEENSCVVKLSWQNDLPDNGAEHISTFSKNFLEKYSKPSAGSDIEGFGEVAARDKAITWDKRLIEREIKFIDYDKFAKSNDALFDALRQLKLYGLVFIQGAPTTETAVESIANRIGNLRETFYGRTWNVKSVPQAKNVAYTSQYLGFHMDLLYMATPPGLQFLHCLKNSCEGGASMFSDSFNAIEQLRGEEAYETLLAYPQTFHYDNDGEHYRYTRPVIVPGEKGEEIQFVNWSPPFQGPFKSADKSDIPFADFVAASKKFSSIVESPESIYEYKMQEGDCVIFNNRRALHARREFDTTSGERLLKGAYVDTDVFNSKYRVLLAKNGAGGARR